MKINYRYFTLLLFMQATFSHANGAYDQTCLDRCFKTGHECNYCNYQCYKDPDPCPTPNYDGDTVCPFNSGPNQGQDNDS